MTALADTTRAASAPRRILVTGATGLIGRQAVAQLLERGEEVHAVCRNAPLSAGARHHPVDLLDPAALDRLIATVRPTDILHFAWYTAHGKFWSAPENLDWQAATIRLARRFAESGGTRFVAAGTVAEYDWSYAQGRLHELTTPCEPRTFYGAIKDATRRSLAGYCKQASVSFAWGRIFFPFGPGDLDRFVPSIALPLLAGREARCNTPTLERDLMSSDEVAAAFVALLGSNVTGPVNIATGIARPLGDMAKLIATIIGKPGLLSLGSTGPSADHPLALAADIGRLRDEVGFVPSGEIRHAFATFIKTLGTD